MLILYYLKEILKDVPADYKNEIQKTYAITRISHIDDLPRA